MTALDKNARNQVDLPDGRSVAIAHWAEGEIPGLAGWRWAEGDPFGRAFEDAWSAPFPTRAAVLAAAKRGAKA
jgi:hypothetical protein